MAKLGEYYRINFILQSMLKLYLHWILNESTIVIVIIVCFAQFRFFRPLITQG